jgi:hypothetical protein
MQQPIECESEVGTGAWLREPATHAILALGITQIVACSTTLYALGVLGKPIAKDTGWSQSLVHRLAGLGRGFRRRSARWAWGHGRGVAADGGRTSATGFGALTARLFAGMGRSRPRHAHVPL